MNARNENEDLVSYYCTLKQLRNRGIHSAEGSFGILGFGGLQGGQGEAAPLFSSSMESELDRSKSTSQMVAARDKEPNPSAWRAGAQIPTRYTLPHNESGPDLALQASLDLTTARPSSAVLAASVIAAGPAHSAAPAVSAAPNVPAIPTVSTTPAVSAIPPISTIVDSTPAIPATLAVPATHAVSATPVVLAASGATRSARGPSSAQMVPSEAPGNRRLASRGRPPRKHTRTRKIESYFEEFSSNQGGVQRTFYKCNRCSFMVTQKKLRERLFHIILCPRIPASSRSEYYENCNDSDRPPLFQYPPFGLNARSAKRIAIDRRNGKHRRGTRRFNCLTMPFDPSREPRFAHYLLEKEKVKLSTPIGKCSENESRTATNLLMQFIVEENIPFAVCDRQNNHPRPLMRFVTYLRPGYKMPLGYRVRGPLLNEYYNTLKADVQNKLQNLMLECRGTLIFDGSEDVNGAPMINILLRIMGSARISTSTFFLTTIYTGYDTVDARYYVQMAEKVVEGFGGFSNLAGVVTDNTGCVKNAREILEKKHPRLVASQDQAHVADRLIGDIGDIEWINGTLTKLSTISSILRRFRKLRARYIQYMTEYNKTRVLLNSDLGRVPHVVSTQGAKGVEDPLTGNPAPSAAGSTTNEDAQLLSEIQLYERNSELGHVHLSRPLFDYEPLDDVEQEESEEAGAEGCSQANNDSLDPVANSHMPPLSERRTAVTLKKLSNVRFASSEGLLDEFIRSRPVLQRLVTDSLFERLYMPKNVAEREKRHSLFRDPVLDDGFLKTVTQIHRIFRACRTYLRVFDSETAIVSEVFEATRILKETFERMHPSFFPEPEKKTGKSSLTSSRTGR